ncbi:MAG: hypothetical protein ACOCX4_06250, partial [Planctomycetota bacterium]
LAGGVDLQGARLHGDWGDGEHVLEPGGLRFGHEGGELVATAPLVREGAGELVLRCRPVEICLPAPAEGRAGLSLLVKSGGQVVFGPAALSAPGPGGGCGVRLYLPVSEQPYEAVCNGTAVAFRHTADGVEIVRAPGPDAALRVEAQGSVILLLPAAAPASKPAAAFRPAPPAAYLFTDRRREVFLEGEPAAVSVRVYGAAPGDAELVLDGPGGPLSLPVALTTGAQEAHAELSLETARLRPGRYTAEFRAAGVTSNRLPIRIAPLLPETNLRLFGYSKWGCSTFEPDDLRIAARFGFNLLAHGSTHGQNGSMWGGSPFQDTAWAGTVPVDESLAATNAGMPPELREAKTEHDAGAEFLLAHGIENNPIPGGAILYFNVGEQWREHAFDRYQGIQHFAQEWRRFPNFTGMVHCTGDGPTPASLGMVWAAGPSCFDIIHPERLQALRDALAAEGTAIEIDDSVVRETAARIDDAMEGAIGFGVGMEESVEVKGDARQRLAWTLALNDLYPRCFREERKALAALMPEPVVTCGSTWGQGAGNGMWPGTFYGALDRPVSDMHGDFGIIPFSYVSGIDLFGLGQKARPWMSLDLIQPRTRANGLKLLLQAMSRNPAGIGVLQLSESGPAGPWGEKKESGDNLAMLLAIARRTGDALMQLERRDEVAVLGSLRQAALGGQSFARLWGAHFLASKGGFQANFVSEEEVLTDAAALDGFKAVFLVDMTVPLPPKLTKRLEAFRADGGVLIASKQSTAPLPPHVAVEVKQVKGANEVNYEAVYRSFDPLIPAFREALEGKLEPFFRSGDPHTHLVRSVSEEIEYWVLFHDGLPDPKASKTSGHYIQFLYEGRQASLAATRSGVLYDALRRQRVDTRPAGDGIAWDADLSVLPGTLYVLTPRPVAALAVRGPASVTRDAVAAFRIEARDADGTAFAGVLPVELTIRDADGAVRYRVCRTTNADLRFKIAANDPVGAWRWRAEEQATGLVAEGGFTVTGEAVPPAVGVSRDIDLDAPAIHSALGERTFTIPLFADQLALRPQAEALAKALSDAGASCRVWVAPPSRIRPYRMNWKNWSVEDEHNQAAVLAGEVVGFRMQGKNQYGDTRTLLDGQPGQMAFYNQYTNSALWALHRDVILLARGDVPEGPLFHEIVRVHRMLPRNPSASVPAPGAGLLGYAWAPFHYGHDAVLLYGQDADGLARATDRLVGLATADAPVAADTPPLMGRGRVENGQAFAGSAGADEPTETVGRDRIERSLLPPAYPCRVDGALARPDGTLLLHVTDRAVGDAPPFVVVDPDAGSVKRVQYGERAFRNASLDRFSRSLGRDAFADAVIHRLADGGRLEPAGRGLSRIDAKGATRWHYDPFPQPGDYEEAKYPRRCRSLTVSADGRRVLASFYDINRCGGYGPGYRVFHAATTVLLDAETGREIRRMPGFLGRELRLNRDGTRALVADTLVGGGSRYGRYKPNPYGEPVLAVFGETGPPRVLVRDANVDRIAFSDNGALALVSYADCRGFVTVVDVTAGATAVVAHGRADIGIAAAPDGAFGVIAYADGLQRVVAPDGTVREET